MWLIVGLGNPGKQYERNRHNVGFRVLDFLAQTYRFKPFQEKGRKAISEGLIEGTRVLALKPLTFMNLSGPPVLETLNFYKIPLSQVIVIHDDLDLAPGKVRLKMGGGHAGHNGLKSLDSFIGPHYWRLRIGIGHPGDRDLVTGYVLSNFSPQDQKWLAFVEERVASYFSLIFQNKSEAFLTKVMQPESLK